jgi:hypothetical protein
VKDNVELMREHAHTLESFRRVNEQLIRAAAKKEKRKDHDHVGSQAHTRLMKRTTLGITHTHTHTHTHTRARARTGIEFNGTEKLVSDGKTAQVYLSHILGLCYCY